MYARLVRYTLKDGARSKAQAVADEFAPAISALKGCGGVTFFGDDADGEYGLFVLWESKEDAEAAVQVIGPRLIQALAGSVKGPPNFRLFEVLIPSS
jgi:quinol monooxygenase YgiN